MHAVSLLCNPFTTIENAFIDTQTDVQITVHTMNFLNKSNMPRVVDFYWVYCSVIHVTAI